MSELIGGMEPEPADVNPFQVGKSTLRAVTARAMSSVEERLGKRVLIAAVCLLGPSEPPAMSAFDKSVIGVSRFFTCATLYLFR